MWERKLKNLVFILFMFILVACSFTSNQLTFTNSSISECDSNQIAQFSNSIHMKLQDFYDGVLIIEASDVISIDVIAHLQDIKSDVMFIEKPECTKLAWSIVLTYMNRTINYYLDNVSKSKSMPTIKAPYPCIEYWLQNPDHYFSATKSEFDNAIDLLTSGSY